MDAMDFEDIIDDKIDEAIEDRKGAVRELTVANFDDVLSQGLVFVKFFAPWCGHCKRLAPTWEDLAKEASELPVSISKVDCTQHKRLCEDHKVRGYPTLKLFHKGNLVEDYRGPRSLEDLYSFVKKHLETLHDEL